MWRELCRQPEPERPERIGERIAQGYQESLRDLTAQQVTRVNGHEPEYRHPDLQEHLFYKEHAGQTVTQEFKAHLRKIIADRHPSPTPQEAQRLELEIVNAVKQFEASHTVEEMEMEPGITQNQQQQKGIEIERW